MKFEKINENKIKITLTASDLKDYNITPETLTLNAEGAQDFLHTLLRRAEDFGFYANGEQIMWPLNFSFFSRSPSRCACLRPSSVSMISPFGKR